MRILLTGGTGQVGSELHCALARLGEVLAPSRNELDLADAKSIASSVLTLRPHLIVNAGGYTAVDRAESEPWAAMKVNGFAPGILAEEAAKCGAAVIHFSTDYVFDGSKPSAYVEEDSPAPLNAYGASKLTGERAVLTSNCSHLVFRTGWIYGAQGRNFMTAVLAQAQAGKELEIVDDQFGAPTPSAWIAAALARIVHSVSPGGRLDPDRMRAVQGLYHMTAAGRTSWHGFAIEIVRLLGMDARIRPVSSTAWGAAAARPANSMLDNGKLRVTFGETPPDWKSALRACLEGPGAPPTPTPGPR